MRWWVETATKRFDYHFVGSAAAPRRWWQPYLRYSAPEDPMVVVESTASGWRLYATAMPSSRLDAASPPRRIRLSLVVEGSSSESGMLGSLLVAYYNGGLSALIDSHLLDEEIDAARASGRLKDETLRALDAEFGRLASSRASSRYSRGTWAASNSNEKGRTAFTAASEFAARTGTRGVFADLNLLTDTEEAMGLEPVRTARTAVILFDDGPSEPTPIPGAEVLLPPNPRQAGPSAPRTETGNGKWGVAVALLLLSLLAVVGVVLLLFRSGKD